MRNNKLEELIARLHKERERLTAELEAIIISKQPHLGERKEGSPFGKREEGAADAIELEKKARLEQNIRGLLADIERALEKFKTGTYGICDICGKQIEIARLEVLPQTNLCLSCRTRQSRGGKRQ